MYKHQKVFDLTRVENGSIEGYQMAHWISRKFENPSQKEAKDLGKVANYNYGQVCKKDAIFYESTSGSTVP